MWGSKPVVSFPSSSLLSCCVLFYSTPFPFLDSFFFYFLARFCMHFPPFCFYCRSQVLSSTILHNTVYANLFLECVFNTVHAHCILNEHLLTILILHAKDYASSVLQSDYPVHNNIDIDTRPLPCIQGVEFDDPVESGYPVHKRIPNRPILYWRPARPSPSCTRSRDAPNKWKVWVRLFTDPIRTDVPLEPLFIWIKWGI